MKKLFLLALLVAVGTFSKVQAQSLKNDCNFFKSTTLMYHAIGLFDKAKEDGTVTLQLKKDIDKINVISRSLKLKYPKDADLKTFTMWADALNKSYSLLNEEDEDHRWQLLYSIIRIDLNEFINEKY